MITNGLVFDMFLYRVICLNPSFEEQNQNLDAGARLRRHQRGRKLGTAELTPTWKASEECSNPCWLMIAWSYTMLYYHIMYIQYK
jgi:hypothetical protein